MDFFHRTGFCRSDIQMSLKISKKLSTLILLETKTNVFKKWNYQNTLITVFLYSANFSWDRKKQAWILILVEVFPMYFIEQMSILLHRNYNETQRRENYYVSCFSIMFGSCNCHRKIKLFFNDSNPLTIFAKSPILDIWQSSEFTLIIVTEFCK